MNSLIWEVYDARDVHAVGFLPHMLDNTEESFDEQLNLTYAHGGGWQEFGGFNVSLGDDGRYTIEYPEDPPFKEIARAMRPDGEELFVVFPYAWCMVVREDGTTSIARCD